MLFVIRLDWPVEQRQDAMELLVYTRMLTALLQFGKKWSENGYRRWTTWYCRSVGDSLHLSRSLTILSAWMVHVFVNVHTLSASSQSLSCLF